MRLRIVIVASVVRGGGVIIVRVIMMRMRGARIASRVDGHFAVDIFEGNGGDGSRSEGGTGIGEIGEGARLRAYGATGVGEGIVGGLVVVVRVYCWNAVWDVIWWTWFRCDFMFLFCCVV